MYILFVGVLILFFWFVIVIKVFVMDKLGILLFVMRILDVFVDVVFGIVEEKLDKWVWKFGFLVFCGLKVVYIRK